MGYLSKQKLSILEKILNDKIILGNNLDAYIGTVYYAEHDFYTTVWARDSDDGYNNVIRLNLKPQNYSRVLNYLLHNQNDIIVIGDKQDGVSGSSTYVDGKLRISYSRGDGEQGADVTRHIIRIKNAIKNISNYKLLTSRNW